jgi:DNA topoisomerase I
MTFKFRGKSGRKHILDVRSRRLAKIVKHCRDLPGYKLFQYIDESGTPIDVTSNDVNDYLREISGSNFTAKDFRTWAGTVLAARALQQFEKCASQTEAKPTCSGRLNPWHACLAIPRQSVDAAMSIPLSSTAILKVR